MPFRSLLGACPVYRSYSPLFPSPTPPCASTLYFLGIKWHRSRLFPILHVLWPFSDFFTAFKFLPRGFLTGQCESGLFSSWVRCIETLGDEKIMQSDRSQSYFVSNKIENFREIEREEYLKLKPHNFEVVGTCVYILKPIISILICFIHRFFVLLYLLDCFIMGHQEGKNSNKIREK